MPGILLALAYSLLFIWLIRKHPFFSAEGISKNAFTVAFIVKILFGFLFWAVYFFHSPYQNKADAFMYFDDGKAIYKALFEHPVDYFKIILGSDDPALQRYIKNTGHWDRTFNQGLYNETRTVIRFNAIVDIFSFGNYHVHTVFMCFLSLIGLTGIFKILLPYFQNKKKELFAIVFFIPSVLFWGSGVLKEGLILFAGGSIIYYWFRILKDGFSAGKLTGLLVFILMLSVTKLYMLIILLIALTSFAFITKTKQLSAIKRTIIALLFILPAGFAAFKADIPFMLTEKQRHSYYMARGGSYLGLLEKEKFIYIHPDIPNRIIPIEDSTGYCKITPGVPYKAWYQYSKQDTEYVYNSTDTTTYWVYYDQPAAGSYIKPSLLQPTFMSLTLNSPMAFINTAFRPHIFEMKKPIMVLPALENTCIIIFILICLIFYSAPVQNKEILLFCLIITVFLFVLIGLTTPILGAVVRYKIPALPFFLMTFLLILDKDKLLKKLPFLKKIIG